MGKEVGNAQVAVFPVFHGFRGKVNTEVSASGREAGKAFSNTFRTASATTAPDLSKLKTEVRSATQLLSKARLDQADAAGKVRVAEARLAEAVEKTGKDSARSVAAQEQLASAQRKLETASQKTTDASQKLASAQTNLARETAQAGQSGSRGATQYARGWEGVKQRLSSTLRGAVRDAGNDAEEQARRSGKASGGAFASTFKGLVAGVGALGLASLAGDFLRSSNDEARESQKVNAITANAIKVTGGAAKVTADEVASLAEAISNKTGIDDEAVQSGANLLLTFKNVKNEAGKGGDIFSRATAGAQDLAAAGFGSADGAAKMLGKALNDPVKGISALSRAGVTFTDQQKNQIKAMVESGDVLGAQKIIMAEVESQVGGAAEAAATSADKMSVKWGNFKEAFGAKIITPGLDAISGTFGGFLDFLTANLDPAITGVQTLFSGLGEGAGGLQAVFAPVAAWFQGSVLPLLEQLRTVVVERVQAVIAIFGSFASGMQQRMAPAMPVIQQIFGTIGQIITGALGLITTVIQTGTSVMTGFWQQWGGTIMDVTATIWNAVLGVIQPVLTTIQQVIATVTAAIRGDWSGVWSGILGVLRGVWDTIVAVIRGALSIVGSIMSAVWAAAVRTVSSAWTNMATAVSRGINSVVDWVKKLPSRVVSAIGDLGGKLVAQGRAIIDGFWRGMKQRWDDVTGWISGIGTWIANNKGPLDYDRKLLIPAGRAIMDGLVRGLDLGMPLLERKLDAITDSVVNQTAGMGVSSRTFAQAAMGAAANAARSVPQVGGSTIAAGTGGSASSPAVTALEVAFRRAMEGMTMNARFDNIDRLATYTTARVVLAAERL